MLSDHTFKSLHRNDHGSIFPNKDNELLTIGDSVAFSFGDSFVFSVLKDRSFYEFKNYPNTFFAFFRLPKDGVKLLTLECFCRNQIAPSSASGASS